jgi:hypothetical protein
MNTNPQREVSSPFSRAEAAGFPPSLGPAAALPFPVKLPYAIMRFLDTLGMADNTPWRPTNDQDEPPF